MNKPLTLGSLFDGSGTFPMMGMLSGIVPRVSVAFATHNATAIGSVQPIAGTTSRLMRATIWSLVSLFSMISKVIMKSGKIH